MELSPVALLLRTTAVVFVTIAMVACGKGEEKKTDGAPQTPIAQAQTRAYGKEDGECYAGIVRAFDAKHLTQTDFHNWKEKLSRKDKEWLIGFIYFLSNTTRVVNTHMGKPLKQLYESNLITINQLNVTEGYLNVFGERDPLKASSVSADACVRVGFSKGADTN